MVSRRRRGTVQVLAAMSPHFCMLAQPYDEERVKEWPVAVEPKLDGFRLLAEVNPVSEEVMLWSRSGKPFTSLEHLKKPLVRASRLAFGTSPVWFDGEVVSNSFKETSSTVRRKYEQATDAIYHVFDAWRRGREGKAEWIRRGEVCTMIRAAQSQHVVTLTRSVAHNGQEVLACYKAARGMGYEGVIVKDTSAPYEFKRSYAWMKLKGYASEDLKIVGVFAGEGKHKGRAGGIECIIGGEDCDNIVRVGTGFTDMQREEIWTNREDVIGRIAEVGYHEKTPAGSLRHPRFVRFRDTLHKGEKE